MTTLFKDFDHNVKSEDINGRYITTPTIEQLYEMDKKSVDDFLDDGKQTIKVKHDELSKKNKDELTGTESLYLKFSQHLLPKGQSLIDGSEGLFSTLWTLIKRFFSMIGNFFKWLGEVFFGFGKKSKTDLGRLEAKIKAGEIKFDEELAYPGNAKLILDSHKLKSYPENLDWLTKELDFVLGKMKSIKESFTEAKSLFAKVQDKSVKLIDVVNFGNTIAKDLGTTVAEGTAAEKKRFSYAKLVGSTWFDIQTEPKRKVLQFTIVPIKPTEVKDSKFKVSEARYDDLAKKLAKTADMLMSIGDISKQESALFGIKLKTDNDLEGMSTAEAYTMTAAVGSLVSYISFVKNGLSALQRADTAAHDIMRKAFK